MELEHFIYTPVQGRGWVILTSPGVEKKVSQDTLTDLCHVSKKVEYEARLQMNIGNGLVALTYIRPNIDQFLRDTYWNHTVLVPDNIYDTPGLFEGLFIRKLDARFSPSMHPLYYEPGSREELGRDEVKALFKRYSPERVSSLLSAIVMSQVSPYYSVMASYKGKPEEAVKAVYTVSKMLPRSMRLFNYSTMLTHSNGLPYCLKLYPWKGDDVRVLGSIPSFVSVVMDRIVQVVRDDLEGLKVIHADLDSLYLNARRVLVPVNAVRVALYQYQNRVPDLLDAVNNLLVGS